MNQDRTGKAGWLHWGAAGLARDSPRSGRRRRSERAKRPRPANAGSMPAPETMLRQSRKRRYAPIVIVDASAAKRREIPPSGLVISRV